MIIMLYVCLANVSPFSKDWLIDPSRINMSHFHFIMELFKYSAIATGLYPYSFLSNEKSKLANIQLAFSIFLILISLGCVVQDMEDLLAAGKVSYGLGGPTVLYSLIVLSLMQHFIAFFLRLFIFIRVSLSFSFSKLFRRLKKFQVDNLCQTSYKKHTNFNRIMYFINCSVEIVYVYYNNLFSMPSPIETDYYVTNGWFKIIVHSLGVLYSSPLVLDVTVLGALLYMDFITESLECTKVMVKACVDSDQLPGYETESESLAHNKPFWVKSRKNSSKTVDVRKEFILFELRPASLKIRNGDAMSDHNPSLAFEQLKDIWMETKDLLGIVLLIAFSTWSIHLVSDTFHVISATIDLGSPFHPTAFPFYLFCVFLCVKLVTLSNSAQGIQNKVQ
jgi:hypothetical protein